MPKTKSAQLTVDKWQRRAAVSQPEYTAGVQNPRTPWDQASTAAEGAYKAGVTAAANAGAFGRGVQRAGLTKWQQNSLKKGPSRFVEGVQLSGAEYQNGIQAVLQTIEAVTLPPRGPKGSPQNYQRVAPIGEALRKAFSKTGSR